MSELLDVTFLGRSHFRAGEDIWLVEMEGASWADSWLEEGTAWEDSCLVEGTWLGVFLLKQTKRKICWELAKKKVRC